MFACFRCGRLPCPATPQCGMFTDVAEESLGQEPGQTFRLLFNMSRTLSRDNEGPRAISSSSARSISSSVPVRQRVSGSTLVRQFNIHPSRKSAGASRCYGWPLRVGCLWACMAAAPPHEKVPFNAFSSFCMPLRSAMVQTTQARGGCNLRVAWDSKRARAGGPSPLPAMDTCGCLSLAENILEPFRLSK